MRDRQGRRLIGSVAQVREMDRRTIDDVGISGLTLMESAGAGTARLVLERKGRHPQKAVILCGNGNNGGDGYVVARHLTDAGWLDVVCVAVGPDEHMTPDAAFNQSLWREVCQGQVLRPGTSQVSSCIEDADVLIDGLFGTGLNRALQGAHAHLVELANKSRAYRVALDVPSGLVADTGCLLEPSFKADLTTTYGVSKFGLHQFPGAAACGEVQVVTIGLPRAIVEDVGARGRLIDEPAAAALVPQRPADGHKGTFGHVGVLGGACGMEGAAIMSAVGALRVGCGLVTWNRPNPTHATEAEVTRPAEVMVHDVPQAGGLDTRSGVLVVGPGLGRDAHAQSMLAMALATRRSMVIDADALRLLQEGSLDERRGRDTVLTPHPAEAAQLLGLSVQQVQADRPGAAQALVDRFRAVVVLKGASTLIGAPHGSIGVVDGGQPALAVAGSGDVLAGMCAGLLAQGLSAVSAAQLAVFVHARAGDRVAELGAGRGALADEIAQAARDVFADLDAARNWL